MMLLDLLCLISVLGVAAQPLPDNFVVGVGSTPALRFRAHADPSFPPLAAGARATVQFNASARSWVDPDDGEMLALPFGFDSRANATNAKTAAEGSFDASALQVHLPLMGAEHYAEHAGGAHPGILYALTDNNHGLAVIDLRLANGAGNRARIIDNFPGISQSSKVATHVAHPDYIFLFERLGPIHVFNVSNLNDLAAARASGSRVLEHVAQVSWGWDANAVAADPPRLPLHLCGNRQRYRLHQCLQSSSTHPAVEGCGALEGVGRRAHGSPRESYNREPDDRKPDDRWHYRKSDNGWDDWKPDNGWNHW
jgi:hypothetical protein